MTIRHKPDGIGLRLEISPNRDGVNIQLMPAQLNKHTQGAADDLDLTEVCVAALERSEFHLQGSAGSPSCLVIIPKPTLQNEASNFLGTLEAVANNIAIGSLHHLTGNSVTLVACTSRP